MKKIIITDALKQFLEGEQNFMLRSDIHVFTASSSKEVLDIHRAESVHLIILDLNMPDNDGDELCSAIRRDGTLKDVSIILACPGAEDAIDRCVNSGANAIVTKPVFHRELINKASELLDIPQRQGLRIIMNISVEGKFRDAFYCTSKDVSTSGMLVETNKALREGDRITFSIFLRLNRITIDGDVVRVTQLGPNHYQYGLKFINMDQKSRDLIEEYIKIRQQAL
jgi:CheY-like chemotaxis protein